VITWQVAVVVRQLLPESRVPVATGNHISGSFGPAIRSSHNADVAP
jgi:hypothetical protein